MIVLHVLLLSVYTTSKPIELRLLSFVSTRYLKTWVLRLRVFSLTPIFLYPKHTLSNINSVTHIHMDGSFSPPLGVRESVKVSTVQVSPYRRGKGDWLCKRKGLGRVCSGYWTESEKEEGHEFLGPRICLESVTVTHNDLWLLEVLRGERMAVTVAWVRKPKEGKETLFRPVKVPRVWR